MYLSPDKKERQGGLGKEERERGEGNGEREREFVLNYLASSIVRHF